MNSLSIANILADCPSGVLALPPLWTIKCQQDSLFQTATTKDLCLQRSMCMLERVFDCLAWKNISGGSIQELNKIGDCGIFNHEDSRGNPVDVEIFTAQSTFKTSNSIIENCEVLHKKKIPLPNTELQKHNLFLLITLIEMDYDLDNDRSLTPLESQPILILLQPKLIKGGFRALALRANNISNGNSNLWGVHMEGFRC